MTTQTAYKVWVKSGDRIDLEACARGLLSSMFVNRISRQTPNLTMWGIPPAKRILATQRSRSPNFFKLTWNTVSLLFWASCANISLNWVHCGRRVQLTVQRLWCSFGPKYATSHSTPYAEALSEPSIKRLYFSDTSNNPLKSVLNSVRTRSDFSILTSIQNLKSSTKRVKWIRAT